MNESPLLPLAKTSTVTSTITGPILRIHTGTYHEMKRRVRPVLDAADMSMFHGIEVNVVDVAGKIVLVPHGVLPISALPNATLPFADTACGDRLIVGQSARKCGLDQPPAQRVIGVAFRQCPDRVQMVWKYHCRRSLERVSRLCIPESSSQQIDVFREQAQPAIGEVHGEKIAAARDEIAPVIRLCQPDGFPSAQPILQPLPRSGAVGWVERSETHQRSVNSSAA